MSQINSRILHNVKTEKNIALEMNGQTAIQTLSIVTTYVFYDLQFRGF